MQMLSPNDIKQIRVSNGLTAQEFADKLGVHIDTVFKWERGSRHPQYEMQVKLNSLFVARKPRKERVG